MHPLHIIVISIVASVIIIYIFVFILMMVRDKSFQRAGAAPISKAPISKASIPPTGEPAADYTPHFLELPVAQFVADHLPAKDANNLRKTSQTSLKNPRRTQCETLERDVITIVTLDGDKLTLWTNACNLSVSLKLRDNVFYENEKLSPFDGTWIKPPLLDDNYIKRISLGLDKALKDYDKIFKKSRSSPTSDLSRKVEFLPQSHFSAYGSFLFESTISAELKMESNALHINALISLNPFSAYKPNDPNDKDKLGTLHYEKVLDLFFHFYFVAEPFTVLTDRKLISTITFSNAKPSRPYETNPITEFEFKINGPEFVVNDIPPRFEWLKNVLKKSMKKGFETPGSSKRTQ